MCRAVTCRKCNKTTWAGCGQHVSQVMAGIPASQRCAGHSSDPAASGGGFLVVPALVLALGLPMAYAAGTSLVVITIT